MIINPTSLLKLISWEICWLFQALNRNCQTQIENENSGDRTGVLNYLPKGLRFVERKILSLSKQTKYRISPYREEVTTANFLKVLLRFYWRQIVRSSIARIIFGKKQDTSSRVEIRDPRSKEMIVMQVHSFPKIDHNFVPHGSVVQVSREIGEIQVLLALIVTVIEDNFFVFGLGEVAIVLRLSTSRGTISGYSAKVLSKSSRRALGPSSETADSFGSIRPERLSEITINRFS